MALWDFRLLKENYQLHITNGFADVQDRKIKIQLDGYFVSN
jgi:hypothetical protein